MKEIPLTKGYVAIVDDEDYEWLRSYKWQIKEHRRGRTHVLRYATARESGTRKTLHMHRLILGADKGMLADHINGNGLDNRRSNLRLATPSQSVHNTRIGRRNKSGYKGVFFRQKTWQAWISVNHRKTYLGGYETAELAARAYDKAARERHGEYARLNFP